MYFSGSTDCVNNKCVLLRDKLLVIQYTRVTWYKAVSLCWQKNMEIATFTKRTLRITLNELYSKDKVDGHFWIGLTKSKWTQGNQTNISFCQYTFIIIYPQILIILIYVLIIFYISLNNRCRDFTL